VPFAATTALQIVMAEQITRDVVKEAQSVGGPAPIDDTASTTNNSAGNGEAPSGPNTHDSNPSDDPTATNATNSASAASAVRPSEIADGAIGKVSGKHQQSHVHPNIPRPPPRLRIAR
jgi:hypothetical protein